MCNCTCSQLTNYIEESIWIFYLNQKNIWIFYRWYIIHTQYKQMIYNIYYGSPIKADGFKVKIISQTRSTNFGNFMSQFSWTTYHDSNIFAFKLKHNFCKISKIL